MSWNVSTLIKEALVHFKWGWFSIIGVYHTGTFHIPFYFGRHVGRFWGFAVTGSIVMNSLCSVWNLRVNAALLSRWLCPSLLSPPASRASTALVRDLIYHTFKLWPTRWVQWLFIVSMCFDQMILFVYWLTDCISSEELPIHLFVDHFEVPYFFLTCDINLLSQLFKRFFSHTAFLSFKFLKLLRLIRVRSSLWFLFCLRRHSLSWSNQQSPLFFAKMFCQFTYIIFPYL